MRSYELKQKRWVLLFGVVTLLVLAQVVWWTAVFFQNVSQIQTLKTLLADHGIMPLSIETVVREGYHKRLMFLSEGIFFVCMTCLGMWFLFRGWRSEEKSRQSQRNFIEVLAHESKTPLTALKLRLESILEGKKSEPWVSKDVQMALEEVRRLSGIVEKTLQLNRMERYTYSFDEIDLADTVKEVIRRMDPVFKMKNVEVEFRSMDSVLVAADFFGIQNTVQSLLENSVLYNDASDKKIWVSVHKTHSQAVLWVSDNGSGIQESDKERVFDRFYRGKNSRRIPGTGLGLYLAQAVVRAHQGVIRLLFDRGPGTHFEVQLPLSLRVA